MTDNSIEVFRLRRERKLSKDLSKKTIKVDHKPVLKMQLQEQSNMNIGVGMNGKVGTDFVEVVSGIDSDRANQGRLDDEVKDLKKKTNYSMNSELNEAAKAAVQFLEEQKAT